MLNRDSVLVLDLDWVLVLGLELVLVSDNGRVCVCVRAGRRYDIGALVLIMFSSLTNRVREGFFQARMLGEHQGTAVADRGQVTGYQLRSGALEARPDVGTGSAFSADVKPGRRLGQFLGRM